MSFQNEERVESGSELSCRECVICYESLSTKKNLCITECGHEFCFSCMMKHVQRNNGCPICRTTIIEELDESDSDTEEDVVEYDTDEFGSDEETIEENENDLESEYSIEQFESAFIAKGYGLKDALSLLMSKFSKTDEKYTKSYIKKLEADVDDMHEELQRECEERSDMSQEDANE